MIDKTARFLVDQMNRFLATRVKGKETHVVLASPIHADGDAATDITDKIIVTLVNIEREFVAGNTAQGYARTADGLARSNPPLNLNLVFLVSANYPGSYENGLNFLSSIVAFFQGNPVFNARSAPGMPANLDRLTVEWQDQSVQSIHSLWTALGGKYLPSVVYKVRMLVLEDSWLGEDVPLVTATEVRT